MVIYRTSFHGMISAIYNYSFHGMISAIYISLWGAPPQIFLHEIHGIARNPATYNAPITSEVVRCSPRMRTAPAASTVVVPGTLALKNLGQKMPGKVSQNGH